MDKDHSGFILSGFHILIYVFIQQKSILCIGCFYLIYYAFSVIQIRLTQQTSFSAVITVNLVRVTDIPLHLLHTSPNPPPTLNHTVNHAIKKSLRISTSVMESLFHNCTSV